MLHPVHRLEDDELCGFVLPDGDAFIALTVFHGRLAVFASRSEAIRHVLENGLASLHQRWHYRADPEADWEIVLIQEARPGWARIVLGYYSLPGVPTVDVELGRGGSAELVLEIPTGSAPAPFPNVRG